MKQEKEDMITNQAPAATPVAPPEMEAEKTALKAFMNVAVMVKAI